MKKVECICYFVAFLVCTSLFAQTPNATDYRPQVSPDGKLVVYYSFRDGTPKIYVCDINGKNEKEITDGTYSANMPVWSNDGKKIAYRDRRNGKDGDIYVMNRDGSNAEKLFGFEGDDTPISWSADGSKLFFSGRTEGSTANDIFSIAIATGTVKNLSNRIDKRDSWGAYSAKTKKIVYESAVGGQKDIFMMDEDGSNKVNLTNNPANDEAPSITDDGKYVSFRSNRDNATAQYYMEIGTQNVKRVTDLNERSYFAGWSPDNKTLLYDSDKSGGFSIFSKNVINNKVTRITFTGAHNANPSVSENGKIAFESKRDGNSEIYVMNEDGKNQMRLTNNSYADASPKISYEGSMVAFVSDKNGKPDIFTIKTNKKNGQAVNITNSSNSNDDSPSFSVDSKKIAFVSDRKDGKRMIHTMNIDGTNIVSTGVEGELPNWGIDGRITFTKMINKNWEVYTMWPDGTDVENVSQNDKSVDFYSNWSFKDDDDIVFASNRYSENSRSSTAIFVMNRLGKEIKQLTKNPDDDINPHITKSNNVIFESRRDAGNKQIFMLSNDGSLRQLTN